MSNTERIDRLEQALQQGLGIDLADFDTPDQAEARAKQAEKDAKAAEEQAEDIAAEAEAEAEAAEKARAEAADNES